LSRALPRGHEREVEVEHGHEREVEVEHGHEREVEVEHGHEREVEVERGREHDRALPPGWDAEVPRPVTSVPPDACFVSVSGCEDHPRPPVPPA
jgi:hypothetical protein